MPKTEVAKEAAANAAVAEEPRSDDVKCDNHPQRKARTFNGDNAYVLHLCDECTPPWFKDS